MGIASGLYQCPACTASIAFKSMDTQYMVCPTCGAATRQIEGSDVLMAEPVYVVNGSNDLIVPGTTGKWKDQRFEVLGRMRIWLGESVVNYWTIRLDDGALHYLMESYGLYAVLTHQPLLEISLHLEAIQEMACGTTIKLSQTKPDTPDQSDLYVLQGSDHCRKYETEGETWTPYGVEKLVFYDLASTKGKYLAIIVYDGYPVAYEVQDISFTALQLQSFSEKPVVHKEIICPDCQETILLKSYPYAQSCTCTCGVRLALSYVTDFRKVGEDKSDRGKQILSLGSAGNIKGIDYEIIGYALKQDEEESMWREYVLYNRREGYAFLSEYQGHWIYTREKSEGPVLNNFYTGQFNYDGSLYDLYNKYTFNVVSSAGEFPCNAFNGLYLKAYEFISPPYMWVIENSNADGINCYFGEHISSEDLEKAFGRLMPSKTGIGMLEPKGYIEPGNITKVTLIGALLLLAVHLLTGVGQKEKVLLEHSFAMADSVATPSFVTGKFELDKWRSNVLFDINAPVSNSWFEADITLVNATTGEEYAVDQGVEYYYGVEDGESWSEGSSNETAYLNSIPAGTYFIQVQAIRDPAFRVPTFSMTITNDVPQHRNFFILLLLLMIWPVVRYYMVRSVERERWYNSSYSPYTHNDE